MTIDVETIPIGERERELNSKYNKNKSGFLTKDQVEVGRGGQQIEFTKRRHQALRGISC